MKDWEVKLLGLLLPWWLLALPFVGGPLEVARIMLGCLGLPLGFLVALRVSFESHSRGAGLLANWFLFGVASIVCLVPVGIALFSLLLRGIA